MGVPYFSNRRQENAIDTTISHSVAVLDAAIEWHHFEPIVTNPWIMSVGGTS